MTKKILIWGGVAFLIFFIAYRPESVSEVFTSLGNTVADIARGFGDLFDRIVA